MDTIWLLSTFKTQIHVQNYLHKQIQQIQIAVKCNVNSYSIYHTQTRDIFLSPLMSF